MGISWTGRKGSIARGCGWKIRCSRKCTRSTARTRWRRALLNPAFMEKLLALGALEDFNRPQMLCDGRVLQIAMPKRGGKNLFEPPSFGKPAATKASLVALKKDIAAVLAAADAVIDLDHRFEVRG